MRLFLDTEFTDILRPQLISLALVSECGDFEFYGELTDFDRSACTRFVWKQVLPKLGRIAESKMTVSEMRSSLNQWMNLLPADQVVISYDFEGDWELVLPLLDGAELKCKPENVWKFIMTQYLPPVLKTVPEKDHHHALHDARVLRDNWVAADAIRAETSRA